MTIQTVLDSMTRVERAAYSRGICDAYTAVFEVFLTDTTGNVSDVFKTLREQWDTTLGEIQK